MKRLLAFATAGVVLVLCLAGVSFVGLRLTFLGYHAIPQDGMYPSMPAGTRVFGWRGAYDGIGDVRRGDLVVFRWERDSKSYQLIWRVLAVAGDRLRFDDGVPVLNGKPVPQIHVRNEGSYRIVQETLTGAVYEVAYDQEAARDEQESIEFEIPPSHLFVVGDNRDHAFDSRGIGAIPFESVTEKVIWSI